MIVYVRWIFAVLLTIPMLLLGVFLIRQFANQTRDLRATKVTSVPTRKRKKGK